MRLNYKETSFLDPKLVGLYNGLILISSDPNSRTWLTIHWNLWIKLNKNKSTLNNPAISDFCVNAKALINLIAHSTVSTTNKLYVYCFNKLCFNLRRHSTPPRSAVLKPESHVTHSGDILVFLASPLSHGSQSLVGIPVLL